MGPKRLLHTAVVAWWGKLLLAAILSTLPPKSCCTLDIAGSLIPTQTSRAECRTTRGFLLQIVAGGNTEKLRSGAGFLCFFFWEREVCVFFFFDPPAMVPRLRCLSLAPPRCFLTSVVPGQPREGGTRTHPPPPHWPHGGHRLSFPLPSLALSLTSRPIALVRLPATHGNWQGACGRGRRYGCARLDWQPSALFVYARIYYILPQTCWVRTMCNADTSLLNLYHYTPATITTLQLQTRLSNQLHDCLWPCFLFVLQQSVSNSGVKIKQFPAYAYVYLIYSWILRIEICYDSFNPCNALL